MAPETTTAASRPDEPPKSDDTSLSPSELAVKFASHRAVVPLLSQPNVVYLNSSYQPPSNLIVQGAIAKFCHEALHHPHPKPGWQDAAEEVRGLVARYVNAASPAALAFTRDTTEALGVFIRSVRFRPGDNVVILDSEHPNHAYGWMAMRAAGLEVRQVPTGAPAAAGADTLAPFVDGRTVAVGLSSVMFHSGQRNDVAGICAALRPRGIHVLVDMTQHVGFAAADVRAMGVSAAAFSLHKGLNCPTGLACLYVDPAVLPELVPTPPIVGYGAVANARADLLVPEDPLEFHSTTRKFEHLNVSLIGVSAANAFLRFYLDSLVPKHVEEHLYSLSDELREHCKGLGVGVVGPEERRHRAPHINVLALLHPSWPEHLKNHGIYVTTYRLGVRVSLGFYNNSSDIEYLVKILRLGLAEGLPAR